MGLRLGPLCRRQAAAGTTAWSWGGITSPETQPSPAWGYNLSQDSCPTGCLSLLELLVFALVEEEASPTKAQGWHGLGGDASQIYSTSTPQTPRQPRLPETAALSPTPAPAPPPSLQRTGLDGILNPPIPPWLFQLTPPAAGMSPRR